MAATDPKHSQRRSFADPDEVTAMAGGLVTIDHVELAGVRARRVSHAPGWRWSTHTAPEVGVPRCPRTHVGLMLTGRMWVEPADAAGFEAATGDVVVILPGHDAWTLGEEPAVLAEFELTGPAPTAG